MRHLAAFSPVTVLVPQSYPAYGLAHVSVSSLNGLSSLCLWSVNKKKPLTTVKQAHGCRGDAGLEQPYWVSSVAALQNSDTVASGARGCESPPYQLLGET